MKIGSLTSPFPKGDELNIKTKNPTKQFEKMLTGLIDEVKNSQSEANDLTRKFVSGDDVQLHEVMIAGEKAKTNLQLLMEIRNKAVDMYKELTRIPI